MTDPDNKPVNPPEEPKRRFHRIMNIDGAQNPPGQDLGRTQPVKPKPANPPLAAPGDERDLSMTNDWLAHTPTGEANDSQQSPSTDNDTSSPLPSPPISDAPDQGKTGESAPTGGYAQNAGPNQPEIPTIPPPSANPPQAADMLPTRAAPNPTLPARRQSSITPSSNRNAVPLPRKVSEIDPYATRVTSSAYGAVVPGKTNSKPDQRNATLPRNGATNWQKAGGCLMRMVVVMLFVGVLLALAAGSIGVYEYYRIAATLPAIGDLQAKASQFETTRILDRNGNLLYEILDPNAGRRTYVTLDKISPYLIAATIATEDKDYYTHPGFDPVAIMRALVQNYTSGGQGGGASTITQQLARALLLSPEERSQRTAQRKAREIVLAAEITRRYTKEQVLELYLNENYYGNLSYGIEAASETYFNTTSDKLTLAQSAFLAGLPQAPSVYDVYNNKADTIQRFHQVLVLMYQDSQEKNCIEVSTSRQPVCVDQTAVADAAGQIDAYQFKPPTGSMRYPHWVNYVRSLLEQQYDPQTIYRSGFTVFTTIDPGLQDQAEQILRKQIDTLADRHVTDGALVTIRPRTGEILTMVGSADFYNDSIAGQVNMAVSPRQPGSAIKPLTYVAAFEKGWNPATIIWDVPTAFPPSGDPNDPRPPYEPTNYDGKPHGPVTVRTALSNSYNIPAVKALNFIGVYGPADHPDQGGLVNMAKRLGITSLTRNDYGLALTLGGGEVSLLEMTGAFSVFANDGLRVPPVAITKIVDHSGKVVFDYTPPAGDQVIRQEHAYLISSILSDNNARAPMFGTNSVLNLPFQVAAKTGTTNDFRDNWTVGYTPDVAVGVWVGNADYTPMQNTTGLTGAAPIWAQFMQVAEQAVTGGKPSGFVRPGGIVEKVVCTISGTEPSDKCPEQRSEVFASDQLPPPKEEDLWKKVSIDTWTGFAASPDCADSIEDQLALNVKDQTAVHWIKDTKEGRAWAESLGFRDPIYFVPERICKADDPHPNLAFSGLSDGQTITTSPLDIFGVADAPDFGDFLLQWGQGDDPTSWNALIDRSNVPVKQVDKMYSWDMKDVPPGRLTLRLFIDSSKGAYAYKKIRLNIQVPTPTATSTSTATPTSTSTPTSTHTVTPPPTSTPTLTPEPSNTPVPPTPTASPTTLIEPTATTVPT
ncbi:MAG: transglycosylase domain-containing protein [Anaerolineaceae bacterium]|nr:transglycosylase domain-containing protein [Anaerolineaceae bacterium]